MTVRFLLSGCAISCGFALFAALAGCSPSTGTAASGAAAGAGGTGGGGEGGMGTTTGCLEVPAPVFGLRVLAAEGGPVPFDTTIEVMWSAGQEPVFHLDQPPTWGTIETSNVVCQVDADKPPPQDLPLLECALWTGSPTEVRVSAAGYVTKERTYTAEPGTDCNPETTPIEIELSTLHE